MSFHRIIYFKKKNNSVSKDNNINKTSNIIAIINLERGMPSKHDSSDCADYVPALCTHRPSLLPIERYDELFGQEKLNYILFFLEKP
ncbi:hypothetical protein PFTANZ_01287 [Plasmodium falciparum Tanzania (2000708)]|uniref:Uncharacterized protein n=2 Tax=Plasmodium falciparum TaxID=5833 RepID=A0A024WBU4_PLAFA|nr:hypothetical protein PFTANZ_01287 [Plasmodium falciparum Tanzania (2000708)]